MVQCKIGMVEPRENPLVESAHPFKHLAADDDRMGFRLDPRSRFNFADHLMPVPANEMLVLADMTSTNWTGDIEIRSCPVDEQAVALWLEIDRVHSRGIASFPRSKENVEPAVAHDDIVLDECEPLRFGAVGPEIAGLVRGKESISPHDADPTARGESVKGCCHRARCTPVHEDDPVAPIGSSKQRLEWQGSATTGRVRPRRQLRSVWPARSKVNITAFIPGRSHRCAFLLLSAASLFIIGTCWWTGLRGYSSHRIAWVAFS